MSEVETHCHAAGAGPCVAVDCPIAGMGPLRGHLRPCPGAPGPQHDVDTGAERFWLDRWVDAGPPARLDAVRIAENRGVEAVLRALGAQQTGDLPFDLIIPSGRFDKREFQRRLDEELGR